MKDKLQVIIVDDEPLAREILEAHVARLEQLHLVASCSDAIEANDVLRRESIDIMLIDIQMPQLSGIEYVKMLQAPPKVIFTTAYPDYAIEGFELAVTDYLLKPISFERFQEAIRRATEEIELEEIKLNDKLDTDVTDFFYVKADKKLVKIAFDEILYIEGLKDYVIIRRETDKIVTLQTMKFLEKKLPAEKFLRIHRSYIIAIDRIEAVNGNMVEVIEKGKSKSLPVGKSYRDNLMELVNQNRI